MATRKVVSPDAKIISPVDDPALAQHAVEQALASMNPEPDPPGPSASLVDLPGGLMADGNRIRTAEVRELTGEHEENLARAVQTAPRKLYHFINILLESGTVRIGTEDEDKTPQLLKSLLVGDRDALLIGIRRATYGDDIDIEAWQCPKCAKKSDLVLNLDDIPVRNLENIEDTTFTVKLRRGRLATVRLANGGDQLAVWAEDDLAGAERDTILLSRCLISLADPDGTSHVTAGFARSYATGLSIPDRHAILRQLIDRQPGPQLQDLTIVHDACGEEVSLLIGIGDLFRDLGIF